MASVSDPAAAYDYIYDKLGRVTNETQDISGLTSELGFASQYDPNNELGDLQATIGTTADFHNTYIYDYQERLTALIQQGVTGGNTVAGKRLGFAYNTDGQFTQYQPLSRCQRREPRREHLLQVRRRGRLKQLTHTRATTAPTSGFGSGALAATSTTTTTPAAWAAAIRSGGTSSNPQFQGSVTYAYDNTDQLKGEDRNWTVDATYTYDENGNRTQYTNGSFTRNYTLATENQPSSHGTFSYTYDAEGNLTVKGNSGTRYEYDYDWRNRLTAVRLYIDGGSGLSLNWTMSYGYDALDQMVRRSVDTDGPGGYAPVDGFYSHQNGQIVLEFGQYSYGSLTQRFVWGPETDQLLIDELDPALYGSGAVFYTLADAQGTIHDAAKYIASAVATKIVTHRFIDAYGYDNGWTNFEGESYDGGLFAYTGRFLDNMTGLQWHLHRWYDPDMGRWDEPRPPPASTPATPTCIAMSAMIQQTPRTRAACGDTFPTWENLT